jgi:hypothetical protein
MFPGHRRAGRKPLVARFGGIALRRRKKAVLHDRDRPPVIVQRKELINRLLTGRCELCKQIGEVRVHQIRKLAELANPVHPQPAWTTLMTKRRRKTLVVCRTCPDNIHAQQPPTTPTE